MEGFLLRLSRFLTEFQTLMVIILLTQKSPHLITIFVSAKLRLNAKKNLLLKKNNYNSNDDDNINNDNDNSNNGKMVLLLLILLLL